MKYWLVKSEPSSFSWDDLWQSPKRTTSWEGVRNYQARNFLREMKRGDRVLFYHSSAEPNAIVGIAEVAREAYPDETQFDRKHEMYDPKSTRDDPRWSTIDLRAVRAFPRPVTLTELRAVPALATMTLLQKGSRLSVSAVTPEEWRAVTALAGVSDEG
ncbi:MAG: EVE domain-containing protein [Gemmatimonadaceae bacterium]